MNQSTYFTFESRTENLVGLKLLACSFMKHSESKLTVFLPASLVHEFKHWAERTGSNATVSEFRSDVTGWSVKPHICLHMLLEGHTCPTWVDADIMLVRDPEALWPTKAADELVVTEDPALVFDRSCERARVWGLSPGRELAYTVNTSVLRFGPSHRELISEWCDLTLRTEFVEAQRLPFSQRPAHLLGDQDLLEGLLVSEKYCDVPVRVLRSGAEIVHDFRCGDYRIRDRFRNALWDRSYFVHGQGIKPWSESSDQPLYRLTSVFTAIAREYAGALKPQTLWLERSNSSSRMWRVLSLGNRHLVGCGPILQDWCGTKIALARVKLGAVRRRLFVRNRSGRNRS